MLKQRWRITKMKTCQCMECGKDIMVEQRYEQQYCCNGYPVYLILCDECDEKIFGESGSDEKQVEIACEGILIAEDTEPF